MHSLDIEALWDLVDLWEARAAAPYRYDYYGINAERASAYEMAAEELSEIVGLRP
ncbi:hypothetical protein [Mycobacterium phage WXIN]|nr:hypothetical protein [Mycobacterium phage WXIN]